MSQFDQAEAELRQAQRQAAGEAVVAAIPFVMSAMGLLGVRAKIRQVRQAREVARREWLNQPRQPEPEREPEPESSNGEESWRQDYDLEQDPYWVHAHALEGTGHVFTQRFRNGEGLIFDGCECGHWTAPCPSPERALRERRLHLNARRAVELVSQEDTDTPPVRKEESEE